MYKLQIEILTAASLETAAVVFVYQLNICFVP